MSTGWKFTRVSVALLLAAAFLCANGVGTAHAEQTQAHRKTRKKSKTPPPPLPSGPTGPVQQMPLDSIAAVPPQVSFQNNELTIVAPNSTLADILRAVRKQTGADIDVPAAPERVVTHLGPGPARDVLADLLNGSRFNYVLMGSPGNEAMLTRVVLVPKQVQPAMAANSPEAQPGVQPPQPTPDQDESAQAVDDSATDDSATDDSADQSAAEQEQPANPSEQQQNIKTPQQMLQEMQQRQMMMQQGQQPGQPVPGSGMPPHPPQQQ